MKKLKQLLLVEDDQVSAYLAQMTIGELNIAKEIVICENGQEALDHLRNCIYLSSHQELLFPELIFLDLNMPVMDGDDFLKEFMKIEELKQKNIHVVIVSSASLQKEQDRIEKLPISGYIEKPIDQNKIENVLSTLNF